MRILIAAVGRLKAGPDRALIERYIDRASQAGRSLGLTLSVREFVESRAQRPDERMAQEAATLLSALPDGAILVALDERGETPSSPAFAKRVGDWRDQGIRDLVFAIGGPDGHGDAIRKRADLKLAFGAMTWPHQIVRLLLAEQVYRSMTILSGHPYHRE
ncbi:MULTISPECIES: 23S rRNA (pseudouridine(1915)-N(3))-methyltransferase RlmH [Kaistia]|uniref:23S rRNA (pseudouridine(1915)-N(3))-methyltransferase RlmH n=1 Tax=Kaistia TaxID=166953 RepID=UPI0022541A93|nr:23S rRNA (pseudouridine(1915)-N(3))-methyltransferase RlmH [Kaistia defluvii]MCX5518851.1 23S rRNA (pseudouridine(1915)-N(3))-methyltransferase RlmH [Kaistia defluvii]